MVKVSDAVASRKRRKKLLKRAKGFYGDRKGHFRQAKDTLMKAMAFSYEHRKHKKRDMRRLWSIRINVAARMNGISYSKLIHGLKKAECTIDRKMLANLAVTDPAAFAEITTHAKGALKG